MGKLKWHITLVLALWLAFSSVAAAEQLYVNESGWWRDGGAFNVSGTPIQAAVDAADEGGRNSGLRSQGNYQLTNHQPKGGNNK